MYPDIGSARYPTLDTPGGCTGLWSFYASIMILGFQLVFWYNKNIQGIGGKTEVLKSKEVVQLWVDAFNEYDVEIITALYHENATNHQVVDEPVMGVEVIRIMFTVEFSTAGMTAIMGNIFKDGQWAVLK